MPTTHLPLTEKPVPSTVTKGNDEDRVKTGERREKSQRARAAGRGEGYMPVPVGDQAKEGKIGIFRPLVRQIKGRADPQDDNLGIHGCMTSFESIKLIGSYIISSEKQKHMAPSGPWPI